MAYDLDRWTAKVLEASSSSSSHRYGIATLPAASLTLHLHQTHCRFEHQNGIFMYDTPVRSLLESIRDARLPSEILDLLDATEVRYTGGSLVVEVHDHRAAAAASASNGAHIGNISGLDSSQLGKTGSGIKNSDILRPLSSNEASLSNIPGGATDISEGSATQHPLSPTKSSSPFHASFVTTYRRFEQARMEIRTRKASRQSTLPQVATSSTLPAGSEDKSASGSGNNLAKDSSIHSAVLAAVASATANEPISTDAGSAEHARKLQNAPPVYKIVSTPDMETLWSDLLAMKKEKQRTWDDEDMVEMEAKILALTAPPLCLAPDPSLARIANTLMHDTALPIPPYFNTLPKSVRQAAKPAFARKKRKKETGKDGKAKLVKGKSKAVAGTTKGKAGDTKQKTKKSIPAKAKAKVEEEDQDMQLDGEGDIEEDVQVRTEREEVALQAAMAEQEKQDAAAWMRVMDESFGRTFQPNFARIAYVTDWRSRKEAEVKQAEEAAAAAAVAASSAVGTASPNPGQGNGRPGSGKSSRQHSRAGSVVNGTSAGDIAVLPDIDETSILGASVSAGASAAAHNPKKKSKLGNSQGPGEAGSPAPSAAGDTPTSGPVGGGSGLKLTLPGKKSGEAGTTKKKKDKAKNKEKQGSPDVPVSVPTPTSAGGPNSATSQPTPAQQAIMRKSGASLPKAKLKSNIKLPAANQSPQPNEQQQAQNTLSGNAGPGQSPVQTNAQVPQSIFTNQVPQPQQVQRTFSPMPNMNAQGGQMNPAQQQGQVMGQNQAILNAAQQAYIQHAQANPGIQRPTSGLGAMNMPMNVNMAGMGGMNMLGMNGATGVGMPMSSSPFQQPMQLPAGQAGYNPNPQYNLHRSPQYGMAPLPNQQQQQTSGGGGYNPYAPSGTPLQQNAQLPGGGGTPVQQFSALQFQQLQNLSAAQNPLMHHQAALQNHVQNFGGPQAMPQQQQNQGMMQMAPPGQQVQLNQHMLDQLRRAQQQTTQHVMQHQQQYSPQQQWQPR